MSKTGQTLEKLPQNIRDHIENLKKSYQYEQLKHDARIASGSYTLALYQMGLVTENEKRLLFCYITV